jgi:hypothetical protein
MAKRAASSSTRLERLSRLPNLRVGLISADTMYSLTGHDLSREGGCGPAKSDALAGLVTRLAADLTTSYCPGFLYISGEPGRPVVAGLGVIVLRVGPSRDGGDWAFRDVAALVRFLTELENGLGQAYVQWERNLLRSLEEDLRASNPPPARRPGFSPRLDAARTSAVEVQLAPGGNLALLWRDTAAGDRPIAQAIPQQIHVRLADGLELVGEGDTLYRAFCILRSRLSERATWLCACGNCEFFAFTPATYEFTGGKRGLCSVGADRQELARTDEETVSILDVCDLFRYGPQQVDMP